MAYIASASQAADIFTKALGRQQFERLRDCLTGYADIDTLERSVRSDVNVLRRRLLRKKLRLLGHVGIL